ncbi:hypothetical protein Tco_1446187, partial [Tanacetum coccineum]
IDTAYSIQLNTAYRSPDTVAVVIFRIGFCLFSAVLSPEGQILMIICAYSKNVVYPVGGRFVSEVLNVFPRFFGVLVAEFATGGAVNLTLTMKQDLIIKDLDLESKIDTTMRDFLEMSLRSVVVLPDVGLDTRTEVYGKSICFAPSDGVGSQRHHIVPIEDLNGVLIALVARSGVIFKSTDRIIVSYGG